MDIKVAPIEVDVTQVNKTWFANRNIGKLKHYVVGIFQREGKAIIVAIPNNEPKTVADVILKHISKGCTIYCESDVIPPSIRDYYKIHELGDGARSSGDVHINNVNNMWKDLKRQLKRTHVSVSQKHIQLYCAEVAWRINNRHLTPMEKFNKMLGLAVNVKVED